MPPNPNQPPALENLERQIQWNRLLAVVEEQAQTLIRTAFSTSAREAGDISAGVYDVQGRMLAQAVTGTPGHVNAMAASVRSPLRFPCAARVRAAQTSARLSCSYFSRRRSAVTSGPLPSSSAS